MFIDLARQLLFMQLARLFKRYLTSKQNVSNK